MGADGLRLRLPLGSRTGAPPPLRDDLRPEATIELAGGYVDLATGFGSVWVADDEGQAILRIDARENVITRTYDAAGHPLGVAIGTGAVWSASDEGIVARIDPETDEVTEIRVGGAPRMVATGRGTVWVSVD